MVLEAWEQENAINYVGLEAWEQRIAIEHMGLEAWEQQNAIEPGSTKMQSKGPLKGLMKPFKGAL